MKICLSLFALALWADVPSASASGTVTDSRGGVLADAKSRARTFLLQKRLCSTANDPEPSLMHEQGNPAILADSARTAVVEG